MIRVSYKRIFALSTKGGDGSKEERKSCLILLIVDQESESSFWY